MRSYLASLILGVIVEVIYALVKVRSPAPPAIALLGLLGMLAGEQAIPLVRSHVFKSDVQISASSDPAEAAMADDVRGTVQNGGASDVAEPDRMLISADQSSRSPGRLPVSLSAEHDVRMTLRIAVQAVDLNSI
jgi:XapX domain-containing protein